MTARPKFCIDRIAARDASRPPPTMLVPDGGGLGGARAVVPDSRVLWPNGATLRIGFMGGAPADQALVREVAPRWTDNANLHFDFVPTGAPAQVRIAFDPDDGAWSYLGDRVLDIPAGQPTMNLGWVDEAVVLHEFGHTLGLGHEHQNPAGGIEWNEQAVIHDLQGPPNFWTEAQIRHNVLERYAMDHHLRGTDFDPTSIMLYFFPGDWVVGGQGTSSNEELSPLDKSFIASDEAYPGATVTSTELPVSTVAAVQAELTQGGQEHQYRFDVDQSGTHVVQTTGGTDLVMALYGPDDDTAKVAEDDDSGPGRNPRITAPLGPGRYLVQVRHYHQSSGTGAYDIEVVHRTTT